MYFRCLEPFEEEDRNEDDEQLMMPSFSQYTGDLLETPVNISSSTLQHQNSEDDSTDPGKLLIFGDSMPFSSEMDKNHSVNSYESVVDVNISPPTSPSKNGEMPSKVIKIHRSLVRADMLEIFSDPSILKSSLNAIIIHQLGHEEAGRGNGVLREVFSLFTHVGGE